MCERKRVNGSVEWKTSDGGVDFVDSMARASSLAYLTLDGRRTRRRMSPVRYARAERAVRSFCTYSRLFPLRSFLFHIGVVSWLHRFVLLPYMSAGVGSGHGLKSKTSERCPSGFRKEPQLESSDLFYPSFLLLPFTSFIFFPPYNRQIRNLH